MAKFDFRILLETVQGHKTSYISQSFVDTDVDLVLSSSQVFDRIGNSISCSYQNFIDFSGSDFKPDDKFSDNNLLNISLIGGDNTGSIDFDATNDEYDRLLRYKFFGEKVCNVLGLPNSQWIYVDQVRFPADEESNIFQGNIDVSTAFISDTLTFANNANVNSDIPFYINTGSDRYIKFIDTRGSGNASLIFGYDKDTDSYEINASENTTFNITNLNNLSVDTINAAQVNSTATTTQTNVVTSFQNMVVTGSLLISGSDDLEPLLNVDGNISASGTITSSDLLLTNNAIINGDMTIGGSVTAQEFITQIISTADGSNTFGDSIDDVQTLTGSVNITGSLNLPDNARIKLGNQPDLQIYHNGTNSVISDTGAGELLINGSAIRVRDGNDGGTLALFTQGAGTELRHDNVKKFETSDNGIIVTGDITSSANISASGTILGNRFELAGGQVVLASDIGDSVLHIGTGNQQIQVTGPTSFGSAITASNNNISSSGTGSFGHIEIPDDGRITIGDSGDLKIYHNGNHSIIEDSGTGNLILLSNVFQVKNAANNQTMIQANQGGAVKLLHNNSQKFITTTDGINVTGDIIASGNAIFDGHITASGDISASGDIIASGTGSFTGGVDLPDNTRINLGNASDFKIFHDSSTNSSVIREDGGGDLFLQGSIIRIRENSDGDSIATFTDGAGTELRHDNVKKFETTTTGINVTGKIITSGDVTASAFKGDGSGLTNVTSEWDGTIDGDAQITGSLDVDGNINSSGNISASGFISASNIAFHGPRGADANTIKFSGLSQVSSSKVAGLMWDLPNDDFFLYAHQSQSDVTRVVFEQRDNVTNDAFTFWFNDFKGPNYDAFPLQMRGDRFVVNNPVDRRAVYHRDQNHPSSSWNGGPAGGANNVDFYLLKSGSTTVSENNSLIFADVSDSQVIINGDISASGNLVVGDISASDGTNALQYDVSAHALKSSGRTLDFNGTDFSFNTNDLYVDQSNSNVGLGTIIPSKTLTVEGDISASGELKVESHITTSGNISSSGLGLFNSVGINGVSQSLSTFTTYPGLYVKQFDTNGGPVGSQNILIGGTQDIAPTNAKLKMYLDGDFDGVLTTYQFGSSLKLKAGVSGSSYKHNWSQILLQDTGTSTSAPDGFIQFWTSGSQRAVIDENGKIGIGTTSPFSNLDVQFSRASTDIVGTFGGVAKKGILINNTNGSDGTYANLDFRVDNADARIALEYDDANDGGLHFITDNNNSPGTRMYIASAGNVGIGTTSPSKTLTVKGDISASGELKVESHITASGNISASGELFATDLTLNGSGINIINDSGFEILGTGTQIMNIASERDLVLLAGAGRTDTDDDLHFGSAGVNSQMVLKDGNLGINETTPLEKLHVIGNIRIEDAGTTNYIEFTEDDNERARILIDNSTTPGAFKIQTHDNSSAYQDRIVVKHQQSATQVGIGVTTPTKTLQVAGDISASGDIFLQNNNGIRFERADGTSNTVLKVDTGDDFTIGSNNLDDMILVTDNGEAVRIKGDGKVGISNENPTKHLVVGGDISASGDIYLEKMQGINFSPTQTTFISSSDAPNGVDLTIRADDDIKLQADDNIQLFTGGTEAANERVRILNDGNVGIGTTSPSVILDVEQTDSSTSALIDIHQSDSGTGTDTGIRFQKSGILKGTVGYNAGTDVVSLGYGAFDNSHLSINSNGQVGINEINPSEKLDVNGSIKARDKITSEQFVSGFGGNGFQIETGSSGTLFTVDDLTVRGTMNVFELLIHQIRATNGSLFVSNTGKILTASLSDVANHYSMSFDTGSGYGHSFLVGDLVRAQRFVPDTNGSGSQVFKSDLHIIAVHETGSAVGVLTASVDERHPTSQSAPQPGYEYVRIGNISEPARQGSIYLTADDDNAPYIDVIDGITSHSKFNTIGTTKVRMGKLTGIGTTTFGTLPKYGFYASGSAFLEGSINATSGQIGGFAINESTISSSNNLLVLKSNGQFTGSNALIKGNSEIAGFTITNEEISSGDDFKLNSTNNTLRLGTVEDFNKDGSDVGLFVNGNDGQFFIGKEDGDLIHFDGFNIFLTSSNFNIQAGGTSIATNQFELDANNGDLQISSGETSMSLGDGKILLKGDSNPFIKIGSSNEITLKAGSTTNFIALGNKTDLSHYDDTSKPGIVFGNVGGTVKLGIGNDSNNLIQFDNNNLILKSTSFLFGDKSTSFISSSTSQIEISSSAFHLQNNGQVTGSNVLFSGGTIANWDIDDKRIIKDFSDQSGQPGSIIMSTTSSVVDNTFDQDTTWLKGFSVRTRASNNTWAFQMGEMFLNNDGTQYSGVTNYTKDKWFGFQAVELGSDGVDSELFTIAADTTDNQANNFKARIAGFDFTTTQLAKNNITMSNANGGKITLNQGTIFLSGSGEGQFASGSISFDKNGNLTVSGTLSSSIGNIGGFTLDSSEIKSNNASGDTGLRLKAGGQITASDAKITGDIVANTITANTSGQIGGFTIDATKLSSPDLFEISASTTSGELFISSSEFKVKNNGQVTGSNVLFNGGTITGDITMSSDVRIDGGLQIGALPELPSNDNLIGYWAFDENEGTHCLDNSGNNNTGSILGTVERISGSSGVDNQSTGSIVGNSIKFGGTSNDGIRITGSAIPDSHLATGDLSITAWISPTIDTSEFDVIVSKRDANGDGFQLDLRDLIGSDDGKQPYSIGFAFDGNHGGTGIETIQGSTIINSGSWSFVSVTVDRDDRIKLYVNGELDAISAGTISDVNASVTSSGAPISIGGKLNNDSDISFSNPWHGYIDEVRIYDKVLTENEVRALYLNPAGTGTTKIAGDQITTGKIISNNLNTTEGSEFNLDDGTFKLGGTANPDLSFDGTTLIVSGTVSSSVGNIGGFTIDDNKISSDNLVLSSSITETDFVVSASNFNIKAGGQITASNILADGGTVGGFKISSTEISASDLLLKSSGQITASNADISGKIVTSNITADGGTIGGFSITNDDIKSTGSAAISIISGSGANIARTLIRIGKLPNNLNMGGSANLEFDLNKSGIMIGKFSGEPDVSVENPLGSIFFESSEDKDGKRINLFAGFEFDEKKIITSGSDAQTTGLELNSELGVIGHGDITNREFETHNGQFRFTEDSISTDGGNGITYDDSSQQPLSTDFGTGTNNSIGNQGGTN